MKTETTKKYTSSIFWGVLLICFGLGYLLLNFKAISLPNLELQNLIGSLLIIFGVSLFTIPNYVKYTLNAFSAVLIAWFLLTISPFGNFHWFKHFKSKAEYTSNYYIQNSIDNKNNVKSASLFLNGGAADIELSATNTELLNYKTTLEDHINLFKYDTLNSYFEFNLDISKYNKHHNSTSIYLSDTVNWNINSDLGATDYIADFTNVNINSAYFKSGASNIELNLGSKQNNTDLIFECSASNIEISIPRNAICEVYSNSTLSNTDLDDFEEVNSGFYRSINSSGSSNQKIKITISGSVSNFEINRK